MSSPAIPLRIRTARFILSVEACRDKQGRLVVYKLPPADGGGTFEVAGINDRYHLSEAVELKRLIGLGWHLKAEERAAQIIADYTDVADRWTTIPAINAFLRDCVFNRGAKGALRILQLALGVADDGRFGPVTKDALATRSAFLDRLLPALRDAREQYERRVAPPVGARAKFWPGLVARWNKAEEFARSLI